MVLTQDNHENLIRMTRHNGNFQVFQEFYEPIHYQ